MANSQTVSESGRRRALIGVAAAGAALVLGLPLAVLFVEAFRWGWIAYVGNLVQPDTLHAIGLTALAAIVVVPINVGFGIAAAWLVTRFEFAGRRALLVLLDLPFSVSPIVAGTMYLFLYGARGLFGPYLNAHDIRLMFSVPAIVLAM